jgi:hypothetical protein
MRLFHREVVLGNESFDHDEVVKGHLEGRVTRPGSPQSFLYESPERKDAFSTKSAVVATGYHGQGPYCFHDLRGRVLRGII